MGTFLEPAPVALLVLTSHFSVLHVFLTTRGSASKSSLYKYEPENGKGVDVYVVNTNINIRMSSSRITCPGARPFLRTMLTSSETAMELTALMQSARTSTVLPRVPTLSLSRSWVPTEAVQPPMSLVVFCRLLSRRQSSSPLPRLSMLQQETRVRSPTCLWEVQIHVFG